MYKNSMLSGLLGFFVPALKLFTPRERIARHLRTKKYPFSSTRQDARSKKLYMLDPFKKPTGIPSTCSRKEIMQKISSRRCLELGVGDGQDNYIESFAPRWPFIKPISSRRNRDGKHKGAI